MNPNLHMHVGIATYVTVLTKTGLVCIKTEFNFFAAVYTDTLNIYPFPVCQVLNVNWSTFPEGDSSNSPKSWSEQWHPWRVPIR